MFIIFDLINLVYCACYFPLLLIKGKWHAKLTSRFGIFDKDVCFGPGEYIWVHAVSVGEVLAVGKLIGQIENKFPSNPIVISVVTQTGYAIARKNFHNQATVLYAPLDFSFVVRKFVRTIRPKLYITAETEIWPNLFTALDRAGVKIVVINGRISDQSLQGYRRVKFLTQKILPLVRVFCMQTREDADRIVELGACQERVKVLGNVKFDDLPLDDSLGTQTLSLEIDGLKWIAGSTHPGEEEIILEAYEYLRKKFDSLRLILAPRHPERTKEILRLLERRQHKVLLFSQIRKDNKIGDGIILVDTMGHLKSLYRLADIVFVGKSLAVGGGHNVIEPAFFSKPVFVGPLMANFKDIVQIFLRKGAIVQVRDQQDLREQMMVYCGDHKKRTRLGSAAYDVVQENRGATSKSFVVIEEFLREGK